MKNVGILITTFERDKHLFDLIHSIRKFYDEISIYVVDQGKSDEDKEKFLSNYGCDLIQIPWDSGLSLARNIGMKIMKENYAVICDDDFVFTRDTKLERWYELLHSLPNVGIAAGVLKQRDREWHYEHELELKEDRYIIKDFKKISWKNLNGIPYFYTDLCLNFFMMKKQAWRENKWDVDYKIIQEHIHFFLSMKFNSRWKVIYTPKVMARHNKIYTGDEYDEIRASKQRKIKNWNIFYKKTGIRFAVHRLDQVGGLQVIDLSTGEAVSPHSLFLDKVYKTPKKRAADKVLKETELKVQMEKDTAILVTTFLRDELLFRCINSIRNFYPDVKIYVGDNGKATAKKRKYCEEKNCRYLDLPFDLGVAGVRNAALNEISKRFKFVMIVEDDIIFTDQTKLEKLRMILEADPEVGIAGALLKRNEYQDQHYEADIWVKNKTLYIIKNKSPDWKILDGIKYCQCGIILNVFMMRKEVWDLYNWDAKFKTALEHSDFFLGIKYQMENGQPILKNGNPVLRDHTWKVAYTPSVSMFHKTEFISQEYSKFRARRIGWIIFGKKWKTQHCRSSFTPGDALDINFLEEKEAEKAKEKTLEADYKAMKTQEENPKPLTKKEEVLLARKKEFWNKRAQQ